MSELEPWERQPYESDAQWQAFRIFRDLGLNRCLRMAWEKYRAARGLRQDWPAAHFKVWSANNEWFDRAAAWDAHQDEVHRNKLLKSRHEALEELADRAPNMAQLLLGMAAGQGKNGSGARDRTQLDAIQDVLDRIGVTSPDMLQIDANVTSEQSVTHGVDDEALERVFDELDDSELAVAERVLGLLYGAAGDGSDGEA